jgi:pilus assembly protein Flp/PilA
MRFTTLRRLRSDETGATAIEYGLIAALIAVAAITALQATGNSLSGTLTTASNAMGGSTTSG